MGHINDQDLAILLHSLLLISVQSVMLDIHGVLILFSQVFILSRVLMVSIMEKLSIVVKKIQAKEYIFLEKYPPPIYIQKYHQYRWYFCMIIPRKGSINKKKSWMKSYRGLGDSCRTGTCSLVFSG